jgi:redox-sensitive bicupin YhaK (pirin superfamily)
MVRGEYITFSYGGRYIFIAPDITQCMIKVLSGHSTQDGAGVKLFRVFSNETVELTDPFLLLDHFGSDNPEDYLKGFPWHPHRGIETVTYMNKGKVEHGGNTGVIGPGDIQWMSAGSGIIHQEMPQGLNGMNGFQLWVNMPAKKKMTAPQYRGIARDEIKPIKNSGVEVRVIAGEYERIRGPVHNLVIDVVYVDVTMDANNVFKYSPKKDYTTLCYVVQGTGSILSKEIHPQQLVLSNDTELTVKSHEELRFLLISGKPLREQIAWGGPIVMNTREELELAYRELQEGTFIKTQKK